MTPARPTIYVTGWNFRRMHGPGPKLSIMAYTPRHYVVDGHAYLFMPATAEDHGALADEIRLMTRLVADRKAGLPTDMVALRDYRASMDHRFAAYLSRGMLAFGELGYVRKPSDAKGLPVPDGASLLCTCSEADAANGECHRAFLPRWLALAGWRVIVDGREWAPGEVTGG